MTAHRPRAAHRPRPATARPPVRFSRRSRVRELLGTSEFVDAVGPNRLLRAMGWGSFLLQLLDYVRPETPLVEQLLEVGFRRLNDAESSIVQAVLGDSPPDYAESVRGGPSLRGWGSGVAEVEVDGEPQLLVREDELGDSLSASFWSKSSTWMIENAAALGSVSSVARFAFTQVPPPPAYIGRKPASYYIDRVRAQRDAFPGRGHTVLIRGPSGVGKAVLAFHVASGVGGRTLRLPWALAQSAGALHVLTQMLQPDVLVLDDVDLEWPDSETLVMFEALRARGVLALCTLMETGVEWFDREPKKKIPAGVNHVPGLRPGRIDDVWHLKPPTAKMRTAHLKRAMGSVAWRELGAETQRIIVQRTHGLTGAFVEALGERLGVYGVASWEHELQVILSLAPGRDTPRGAEAEQVRLWKKLARQIPG